MTRVTVVRFRHATPPDVRPKAVQEYSVVKEKKEQARPRTSRATLQRPTARDLRENGMDAGWFSASLDASMASMAGIHRVVVGNRLSKRRSRCGVKNDSCTLSGV